MNKKDYINAVDNIKAPEALVEKIEALNTSEKKKTPVWKTVTAVAACFVAVIIAFSGIVGGSLRAGGDMLTDEEVYFAVDGFEEDSADMNSSYDSVTDSSGTASESSRKIVKNASLTVKTKNYDEFIASLQEKIETYGGYVEQSQEYNYDNASNRYANMNLKIPAEMLEKFIEEIGKIGTVTSKTVESTDITDSYIDVESRIKALETEEKTLLGLLEKAESLADVIDLQERLSTVRTELEGMKAQKESYDSMVAYSKVILDINEVERVVEGGDTFLGRAKEKLMNNIYDMADFFRELGINLIAAIPYFVIAGAVAIIVIVIVKKIRKR